MWFPVPCGGEFPLSDESRTFVQRGPWLSGKQQGFLQLCWGCRRICLLCSSPPAPPPVCLLTAIWGVHAQALGLQANTTKPHQNPQQYSECLASWALSLTQATVSSSNSPTRQEREIPSFVREVTLNSEMSNVPKVTELSDNMYLNPVLSI